MSKVLSHKFLKLVALILGVLLASCACVPGVSTAAPSTSSTSTSSTSTSAPTTTSTVVPSTVWKVSTKIGYSQTMVDQYGGEDAVRAKILTQLRQVEGMFVGFSHTLSFNLVGNMYKYDGRAYDESRQPHPEADLLIVYDYYNAALPSSQGWYGDVHSVVQTWHSKLAPDIYDNDVLGVNSTEAVAHELGHAFGAIDIYQMDVNAATNPISHTDYRSEFSPFGVSMMRYPYGHAGQWDAYSRCIIEKSNGQLEKPIPVVSQTLPSVYQIQVKSSSGANVKDASVTLYPVPWGTYTVSTVPAEKTGQTTSNGIFQLKENPFHPMQDLRAAWRTAAGNFLVKVEKDSQTSYSWLTIAEAGLSDCNHHGDPFVFTIVLP